MRFGTHWRYFVFIKSFQFVLRDAGKRKWNFVQNKSETCSLEADRPKKRIFFTKRDLSSEQSSEWNSSSPSSDDAITSKDVRYNEN